MEKLEEWEKKNLKIFWLPTYSPHLNLIEILGRFLKYEWIEFSAYKDRKSREHPNYVMSINAQKGKKAFVITILVPITQFREPLKIYELPKRLAI
jgi:hypothetical protein